MKRSICTILMLIAPVAVSAQVSMKMSYSPDTALVVRIATIQEKGGFNRESAFEFWSKNGKRLAARNFISRNHTKGLGLVKSLWSLDSQYFIFSMMASGGNESGSFPTFCFARADNRIYSLDSLLRAQIINPEFSMENGDSLSLAYVKSNTEISRNGETSRDTLFGAVSLSALIGFERGGNGERREH